LPGAGGCADPRLERGVFLSDNWIVSNLQNALDTWNSKLNEIWTLLTQTPQNFKGGGIWTVIVNIHDALMAIGLGLLVLFFVIGMAKTMSSFTDLKRPEVAFKVFIRFVLAKLVVTQGLELMMKLFEIAQGLVTTVMNRAGVSGSSDTLLPDSIITAIDKTSFLEKVPLWAVTLIGSLFITVLSFVMIMSVYGRFLRLYLYTAIAPVPLSAFAGESTQSIGISFLKSYAAVCLEGVIIVLGSIIFSLFAAAPPVINPGDPAVTQVWKYVGEICFNMLVLVGAVKMADRIVKELMFGG
jgi:hypothetical protein